MTLAGAKFFALCSEDTSMHENWKKNVKAIILKMEDVIQRAEQLSTEFKVQKSSLNATQNCEKNCNMVTEGLIIRGCSGRKQELETYSPY